MRRRTVLLSPLVAVLLAACEASFPVHSAPVGDDATTPDEPKAAQAAKGAEPVEAEPITLLLWHSYRAAERDALRQTVDALNEVLAPRKVRVKLQMVPFGAYADKITAAIPRGRGPDLFIFAHDRLGDWAESHIIEPIQAWVDEELLDTFFKSTVDALVYGNSLYGLPFAFKSTALFYNKKFISEPPRTTDEMIALAQKHRDEEQGIYGLAYQHSTFYFHSPWYFGFGARLFDADGKPVVDSPQAIAAGKFAHKLVSELELVPQESTSILITTLWNQNKAAMVINGPWFRGEIEEGIDYGVAVMPTISEVGKPALPFMGSEAIIMSARTDHKALCLEVMRFLTTDDMSRIRMSVGKQTVANKAVYDDPDVAGDPVMQAFRAQLAHTVPMGNTPAQRVIWTPMDVATASIIHQGNDPAEALERAQSLITSYLSK